MAASWDTTTGDHSLEGYVRRAASQVEGPTAQLSVRDVPADLVVAMRLINWTATVRVKTEAGYAERNPTMRAIHQGMTECGLYELESVPFVAERRSSYLDELRYGHSMRVLAERTYRFTHQGVLSPGSIRVCAQLTPETHSRLSHNAQALHITRGSLICACWVAAVARSEDWLTDRAEAFGRAFQVFTRWLTTADTSA
jgi:hypothetical protein